jgi:hypothetical protein
MTLEEFKKVIGPEYQSIPKERLEALYDYCIRVFNLNFSKWKAEKLKKINLDNSK